jgi:hypothetical protein
MKIAALIIWLLLPMLQPQPQGKSMSVSAELSAADAALESNNWLEAYKHCRAVIAENSEHAGGYWRLSIACLGLGRRGEGLDALGAVARLRPVALLDPHYDVFRAKLESLPAEARGLLQIPARSGRIALPTGDLVRRVEQLPRDEFDLHESALHR